MVVVVVVGVAADLDLSPGEIHAIVGILLSRSLHVEPLLCVCCSPCGSALFCVARLLLVMVFCDALGTLLLLDHLLPVLSPSGLGSLMT